MYIKLLLERLFKDLFLENNVNYCYFLHLCAYNLYLKHKDILNQNFSVHLFASTTVTHQYIIVIYSYLSRIKTVSVCPCSKVKLYTS